VNESAYYIRWIPAVFDSTISNILDKLVQICPDELVTYKDRKLSKIDQILTIVSLFVKAFDVYFIRWGMTKKLEKNCQYNVFNLFLGKKQYFDKFSEQGYEKLVNQWLSKFVLSNRDYELYLVIDEKFDSFTVDIKVSVDDGNLTNINKFIQECKNINLKLQLLSDTYIINEIFPQVNKSIDLNENMEFNIDEFSEFFINTLPLFEVIGINIILPKDLQKIFRPKLKLDLESSKNEKGYLTFNDIIKFDWKVHIGDNSYDINEFKKLALKSRGLVKLNNHYVILDEDETKKLIKDIEKLPDKLNKHELTKALLSGEYKDAQVEIDENLSMMLNNINKYEEITIPDNIQANLRNYQKTGYSWLVQNISTGFGSILADDMGLGKTLQTLAAIQHFKDEGYLDKQKVLVVAPTSLLTNWQEEIRKFTPNMTSYIFHGTKRKFPKQEYDIYLTSYGVIRKDVEKFNKRKWFITIIDEAQNIKNPDTQQTRAVKKIKSKHKIALSGTPVENRLSEYWSIFDFINKGYLSTLKQFRQNYILPIEKEKNQDTLENFKQITQPFILRRLKSDKNIIKDLPDKITNDIYCDLSKQQVSLYKEILDSSMDEVDANEGIKRKGLVLKLITSLKQVCNHPSQYSKSKKYNVDDSGKMQALMNILENILESNEKVLIFTQYVQMGNIMKKLVEDKFNEEVLFLHGSLSRKKRDELVKRFQKNTQSKIFIISLKAGGTGLNLTAASNVIHYDLWWNPAVENQATDRAYRIGQKDNVMVYRFITKGTFEEKINQMIHDKEELAQLTVGSGEQFITEMSDGELREMFNLRRS
jgi:SNF2 family DNA or RNA helicase